MRSVSCTPPSASSEFEVEMADVAADRCERGRREDGGGDDCNAASAPLPLGGSPGGDDGGLGGVASTSVVMASTDSIASVALR
jgi:hypothetical protein